jgi:exopolyphosphatase/guanosine-5'-triphosphate,3'-diphosphate pyrophosphatase
VERRTAVIDIGSGSTTLAVFEAGPFGFMDRVAQRGEPLRLIERIDRDGAFGPAALRDIVRTVSALRDEAIALGAERVEIVATSATRDATNGAALVERLARLPHASARLVTGEEEGRLAAHAVLCTLPLRDGLVVDLGGGSLQVVRVRRRRITAAVSLPLGALRLAGVFLRGEDPPGGDALCALRAQVFHGLRSIGWLRSAEGAVVALGGSARSFGKIDRKRRAWPLGHVHGYALDEERLLDALDRLSRLPREARHSVPGLPEHRVDSIVAAGVVLSSVLRLSGHDGLHLSSYGIREGVALQSLFGPAPIDDPAVAGIHGRLGSAFAPSPSSGSGPRVRERQLHAAASGHPAADLLDRPIQGFWQAEVLRVAQALGAAPRPVRG